MEQLTSAHSFSNLADIRSGPVAFHTDNADDRLRTSSMGTGINCWSWNESRRQRIGFRVSALAVDVVHEESDNVMISGSETDVVKTCWTLI